MRPVLRGATPADIPEILRLVHGLAEYEREPDAVEATPDLYARHLFPAAGPPAAYAEVADLGGRLVGLALWFPTFSTWTGRPGIWLEDLYVEPEHRGAGLGRALFVRLARICGERGYGRLDFSVLRWNAPALGFYARLGAVELTEWQQYPLDGEALRALGAPG
jgi:GNAT superfamily N-acetyltransferase